MYQMGMAIDQARCEQPATAVDRALSGRRFAAPPKPGNAVAFDQQSAVPDEADAIGLRHGGEPGVGVQRPSHWPRGG